MNSQTTNPLFLSFLAFSFFLITGCSEDEIETKPLNQDKARAIIINGNLEEGITNPTGWGAYNPNQDLFETSWTETESFSGNKSLKISSETGDSSDFAFWQQTFDPQLTTLQEVKLSVRIKGNLRGEGVSIALRGDDTASSSGSAGQFISTQYKVKIDGDFTWEPYDITLDSVQASINSLTVYLIYLPNTTGTVYFDDIVITDDSPSAN